MCCLISDAMLRRRYEDNGYGAASLARVYAQSISPVLRSSDIDVLWVEKELLPWAPFWPERFLIADVPYILDYDEAVFHAYDENRSSLVLWAFGSKLDKLVAGFDLVIAGNDYLEDRALRAGAKRVEQVPTVVDINRHRVHRVQDNQRRPVVIGWIGSPSTARYLKQVESALSAVRLRREIRCIAIGLMDRHVRGTSFEAVPWTEDSEADLLRGLDTGIMPLEDSSWERGKCGYIS